MFRVSQHSSYESERLVQRFLIGAVVAERVDADTRLGTPIIAAMFGFRIRLLYVTTAAGSFLARDLNPLSAKECRVPLRDSKSRLNPR